MPAFSFKERFVPMIKAGTKLQTIRTFRKQKFAPGQKAHLYYGMRTEHCTKLVEPSPAIREVKTILLYDDGTLILIGRNWVKPEDRVGTLENRCVPYCVHETLDDKAKDRFAWSDGFRHPDDEQKVEGCFEIMLRWWKQTHDLPFIGCVTYWNPLNS